MQWPLLRNAFIGFAIIVAVVCIAAEPDKKLTEFVKSADGVSIAYEAHGKGNPAIVFIHGWSCDRSYWKHQIQPFSSTHTVVAIDLAGHGESGTNRKSFTMESFGDDVAAVVKKLNLPRIVLVGHSMGGDVIVEAARRLPDRVAGMIWVDVYKKLGPGRSHEEVQGFVEKLRANFKGTTNDFVRSMFVPDSDPELVDWVAADMSSTPVEIGISALDHAMSYSRKMPSTLEELKLPVIAINPDNSPTDMESMKRYGVKVMIMPKVGHFLQMEDPPQFNDLLRAAIDKLK